MKAVFQYLSNLLSNAFPSGPEITDEFETNDSYLREIASNQSLKCLLKFKLIL
jgi:hypothetical protein